MICGLICGLSLSARQCHQRDEPQLLCLVTAPPDRHERRGARRRSVGPTVQGRPGPSATWVQVAVARGRIPANLQTASHSVIEKFWENAAETLLSAYLRVRAAGSRCLDGYRTGNSALSRVADVKPGAGRLPGWRGSTRSHWMICSRCMAGGALPW
jgi:hypothetical protein